MLAFVITCKSFSKGYFVCNHYILWCHNHFKTIAIIWKYIFYLGLSFCDWSTNDISLTLWKLCIANALHNFQGGKFMTLICEIRVLTDVPLSVWRNISFSKHVVVVPIKKLTKHLHNIDPCLKIGPAMWASTFCSVWIYSAQKIRLCGQN